jgi:hypothetical protein
MANKNAAITKYLFMHVDTCRYNATSRVGNAEFNLQPFLDQTAKIWSCRKFL